MSKYSIMRQHADEKDSDPETTCGQSNSNCVCHRKMLKLLPKCEFIKGNV